MVVFVYDKTFEGLLTVVFDAYVRRTFPDHLQEEGDLLPLFCEEVVTVYTDQAKADRVWKGLQKKMSTLSLTAVIMCWLSELEGADLLLFRYIRKTIDSPVRIELNFGDPDVLAVADIWKKVSHERHHVIQFLRFQKAADGSFFAAVEPLYNVLSLTIRHFKDRFADQQWLIYDIKRAYGYYYDLKEVREVRFDHPDRHLLSGKLDETLMDPQEKLFQQMWKEYFQSINIRERSNPKLHRQHMPVRFWKYMTEKQ